MVCSLFAREMSCHINYKRSACQSKGINTPHATLCIRACRVRARPLAHARDFLPFIFICFFAGYFHCRAWADIFIAAIIRVQRTFWFATAALINPFNADDIARRVAQFMRIHFTCAPDSAIFLVIPCSIRGHAPRNRRMYRVIEFA